VGQQLLSRKKPVPLTLVFDTAHPRQFRREAGWKDSGTLLHPTADFNQRLQGSVTITQKLPSDRPKKVNFEANTFSEIGNYDRKTSPNHPRQINKQLQANYLLKDYRAKVVYIQNVSFSQEVKKVQHVKRWKSIADEVDIHITPGTHETMFSKPQVQVLARLVQTECDKVSNNYESA
jgi:thioesterase domain-containing protein